jgi:hypothetical protein
MEDMTLKHWSLIVRAVNIGYVVSVADDGAFLAVSDERSIRFETAEELAEMVTDVETENEMIAAFRSIDADTEPA